jgi:hypothetical protein
VLWVTRSGRANARRRSATDGGPRQRSKRTDSTQPATSVRSRAPSSRISCEQPRSPYAPGRELPQGQLQHKDVRPPFAIPDTIMRDAQTLCVAQIFIDFILNRAGSGLGRFRNWKAPVSYINVAPSHLPSFLLPCPHCGHRMAITAVPPALYANGAASNDLEDVTHTCVQCGTTQISTRRSFSGDIPAVAHRI